jgi:3-carboxy-cis,cis-muconate cycloisomerase
VTFDAIFVPEEIRAAVSDRAWVEAMLEVERALANAESLAGVVPAHLAGSIAEACRIESFDVAAIIEAGGAVGNPAEPLVRALREVVGGEAADYVHYGATSQDIVDSAAMLVSRRALGLICEELEGVAAACAGLAETHRLTPMAARTLLQQAVPTTFGLKAAGWLVAVTRALIRLRELREGLSAQLGGAAGTLAVLGAEGPQVADLFGVELELAKPVLPWHADRAIVADLGAALALQAGACAKIGYDIALLGQTEVGEVRERLGQGGSSTMPHKRNPVGSALAVACCRRVRAASGILTDALVAEHERALGGWQAEWGALSDALAYAGGAAAAVRRTLDGIEIDVARMRANLDSSAMSERLTLVLARTAGLAEAKASVASGAQRALSSGGALRDEMAGVVSPEELDEIFDPVTYLGSAGVFVDDALGFYARRGG